MKSDSQCPKCRRPIPLDDVNVATDIALCRKCGERWSFAELLEEQQHGPMALQEPPAGTWLISSSPHEFQVGSTTRSALAFFLVPFMCFWSGMSLTGIYGTQIKRGHFDLLQSLFGLPFLIGTVFLGSAAAMAVAGKVVVKVAGDSATLWTGVGPVGWKRTFNWRDVTSIQQTEGWGGRRGNRPVPRITITAGKTFNFASGISQERLNYLLAVLRQKWRESRR